MFTSRDVHIPDAYERLILDCIHGDQQHFVRRDELRAAWAIFTPLLHAIDRGELVPEPYPAGSRGPAAAEALAAGAGYIRSASYAWTSHDDRTSHSQRRAAHKQAGAEQASAAATGASSAPAGAAADAQ